MNWWKFHNYLIFILWPPVQPPHDHGNNGCVGVGLTCCTKERIAGLGSAAVTATTREGGEKSNLLYEGFPKLGAPLTVVLVCFDQGVDTYL